MFAITYHGIDGKSKKTFSNLGAVARYLKGQDQGADYRRPAYLQGEFAQFLFDGFCWKDLLTGHFTDEDATYKPELLKGSGKIRWTSKKITSSVYTENHVARSDGEEVGNVYVGKGLLPYVASFGGVNRDAHGNFATLDEAKTWVARLQKHGEEGYYKRRGYWDGVQGKRDELYFRGRHGHLYAEGFDLGVSHKPRSDLRPDWL